MKKKNAVKTQARAVTQVKYLRQRKLSSKLVVVVSFHFNIYIQKMLFGVIKNKNNESAAVHLRKKQYEHEAFISFAVKANL